MQGDYPSYNVGSRGDAIREVSRAGVSLVAEDIEGSVQAYVYEQLRDLHYHMNLCSLLGERFVICIRDIHVESTGINPPARLRSWAGT